MLLFSRSLEPEEWGAWRAFLGELNPDAVTYAFDNWNRNGRFFPKPKDILDLVATHKIETTQKVSCEPECKMRHGKGYDEHDMLWLWKKIQAKVATNQPIQYEALLDELDSKRQNGPPVWRQLG